MPNAHRTSRRHFLTTAAATTAALPFAGSVQAMTQPDDGGFTFEVTRSDEDWRAMLSPHEFDILRGGATEEPQSSPLWEESRPGNYHCKGCALHVYDSKWKVILDKGWAFFAHGQPNSVLMGIDFDPRYEETPRHFFTMIEAHCRRCGSHLGHIVYVEGRLLHCINGTALEFQAADA